MSRILLHPRLLPRFGPSGGPRVYLPPPWRWWRHRLRQCPDGSLFHQQYDDPTDVTECSILFDLLEPDEIHDPPALHVTEFAPEFQSISGTRLDHTLMTRGPSGEVDVVWYEQPGAHWHPLPGNTCRPGDYQISIEDSREDQNTDSTSCHLDRDLPALVWATGRAQRAAIIAVLDEPYRPPNDSRAAEALRNLDEQVAAIYQASRNYEATEGDRPEAVLMNSGDYAELRRSVLRDEALSELTRYGRAGERPFESILGLQVVADRNVPPGRIFVVGRDMMRDIQRMFTEALEGLVGFSSAVQRVGEAARGILSPNEIRESEGLPAIPPRNNVLPEQDVVDEIDRLVNEQVAPGPRDDYHVDRYPKCTHCSHDWHGVLCAHCDCLGELEDPV